ncbi:hypothetical protein [Flammeovirga pacifica]|uniref:Uncharacterized protein n=1 Tax=Flammeovirga pacifica TaxID=915059 RepID=A0A1S1Z2H4_FLAPC|nr:hypothetical protein [Flammeovirga pacifica]OHX67373.1 hypothetical protein NH26_13980 [Flammeovirga pacifica]
MAELSNIYRDPLSPNMGGLYHSIRLIPTDDIEYYPVVVDGFVEFAIIPKEGKTITKWDITRDSGEVSCKLSGPEGGRFWRNTLSFSMPRSSAITQLEGVDLVAIAKDRNGQSRLIGTMDRPAKLLKMESRSGKKAVEGGKYTFEISAINDEEAWIYGDKEFPIPLFAFKSQKIGTINISVTGGSGWYFTTATGEEIWNTNVLSWQRNEADTDTIYLYNSNGLDLSAITTLTASNNIHFGDYDFSEFTNLKTFNWAGNGQDSVILPDNRFKLEGDTIDVTNSFFTGAQFGALLAEIRRVSDTQSVVNRSLKVGTIEDPTLIEVGSVYYDDYVYLQSIGWSINVVSNKLLTATIGANGFIAPGGTISNEGQLMFRVNGEIASNVGSSGEVIEFEVRNGDLLECWYSNNSGDLDGLSEIICNDCRVQYFYFDRILNESTITLFAQRNNYKTQAINFLKSYLDLDTNNGDDYTSLMSVNINSLQVGDLYSDDDYNTEIVNYTHANRLICYNFLAEKDTNYNGNYNEEGTYIIPYLSSSDSVALDNQSIKGYVKSFIKEIKTFRCRNNPNVTYYKYFNDFEITSYGSPEGLNLLNNGNLDSIQDNSLINIVSRRVISYSGCNTLEVVKFKTITTDRIYFLPYSLKRIEAEYISSYSGAFKVDPINSNIQNLEYIPPFKGNFNDFLFTASQTAIKEFNFSEANFTGSFTMINGVSTSFTNFIGFISGNVTYFRFTLRNSLATIFDHSNVVINGESSIVHMESINLLTVKVPIGTIDNSNMNPTLNVIDLNNCPLLTDQNWENTLFINVNINLLNCPNCSNIRVKTGSTITLIENQGTTITYV